MISLPFPIVHFFALVLDVKSQWKCAKRSADVNTFARHCISFHDKFQLAELFKNTDQLSSCTGPFQDSEHLRCVYIYLCEAASCCGSVHSSRWEPGVEWRRQKGRKKSEWRIFIILFLCFSATCTLPSQSAQPSIRHLSLVSTVYVWFQRFVCLFDSQEVCHRAIPVKTCQKPLSTLRVHTHSFANRSQA